MSGDYSRKTFDPRDQFSGVRMQQGRVQLDADWNEQADIQDRRWRAETVDVIGRCGCPDETPDAFRIEISGGELTIGPGRTYVHGLLAENHGEPPNAFNRILAEEQGTAPVPFSTQPYLPNAVDTLPTTAGPALVYLDVWNREVTYLEDPELVEVAVGVDTTARHQTVWQVRVLGDVGPIDCETDDAAIPQWLDIITPSGGRLSTEAVGVTDPMDPCLIPPSGGYRALENRLYRLEIHDPGDPGPATFKWSRYNGTIATAVTALPALDTLRVERTMRDDVLRFNAGDWVEITDDHLELHGLPGVIRRVDSVDDGTRTIVLASDLPAGTFPTNAQDLTDPDRHTRVRRWDQSGVVEDTNGNEIVNLDALGATGVIPVPPDGTSIVLEDGVQVTFGSDPAGAPVRSGDFWCFAARSADGSVEELDDAPPEDIHHHHCRLAVVEFDGTDFIGTPTDCRDCFPPLTDLDSGCCTEVVEVGESIQAALDSLPPEGGCVCVKTGLHTIDQVLRIEGSNVVLHGESPGARIRRDNGGGVLHIASPAGNILADVEVDGLQLETPGGTQSLEPIILAERCVELEVSDCALLVDEPAPVAGVLLRTVFDSRIERNRALNVTWGIWAATDSTRLVIADNNLATVADDGFDLGDVGIWMQDVFGPARIEGNQVTHFRRGIVLNEAPPSDPPTQEGRGSRVAGNVVLRAGELGSIDGEPLFGIDAGGDRTAVVGNRLRYRSVIYGGIRSTGGDCRIDGNHLTSDVQPLDGVDDVPVGIQLGFGSDQTVLAAADSTVANNHLVGHQDAVVVVEAEAATIENNVIESAEVGLPAGIRLANTTGAKVSRNRVAHATLGIVFSGGTGNSAVGNRLTEGAFGLAAGGETHWLAADNQIEGLSGSGILALQLLGLNTLRGNRVLSCGFESLALGIGVLLAFGEVRCEGNEVVNTGVSLDETQINQPAIGILSFLVLESLITDNLVIQSNIALDGRDLSLEDRALLTQGLFDFPITDNLVLGYPIQIVDNNFIGPGATHLVELRETQLTDTFFYRFESVTFSNNHCWHWIEESNSSNATVNLHGRRAIVMGNHVKATRGVPAFDFNGMTGTYIGNDTRGQGAIGFTPFPTPIGSFNR